MANQRGASNTPVTPMHSSPSESRDTSMLSDAKEKIEQVGQTVSKTAEDAYHKAGEFAASATNKASEYASAVSSRAGDYASTATNKAKDAACSVSDYFQEEGFQGMADDVTSMVKRYPLPAICVSFGIGMLLASMTRR